MPSITEETISVGKCASTGVDIKICYSTFGEKTNPCVLLVMGLNTSGLSWWDTFCEPIANAGYYVVRYDNRDVGLSTHLSDFPPPSIYRSVLPRQLSFGERIPYKLEDMAMDGINLLTALGIEKAHVVGCSMGGMIVQIMATAHVDRVLSLTVIFSQTGGPKRVKEDWSTRLWFLDKPASSSIEDKLDFKCRLARRLVGPGYELDEKRFREFAKRMIERSPDDPPAMLRQLFAIQRAKSRVEALKTVKVPTLLIHGMLDALIPYQNSLQIAELVGKSATVVLYPHMGHSIQPELVPDMTNEIIQNAKRTTAKS